MAAEPGYWLTIDSGGTVLHLSAAGERGLRHPARILVGQRLADLVPLRETAARVELAELLRFAAARVMARPDYTDVTSRVNLNIGALSGSTGNPLIDPYRANQYDLSLEWYHDQDAAVAVALFYKDVKSFITDQLRCSACPASRCRSSPRAASASTCGA